MKKFVFENIMKVADLDYRQLSKELLTFIRTDAIITYEDQKDLKEHLYNIFSTIEDIEAGDILCHESIADELNDLKKALDKKDAAYLRIIS